jgi:acyl-lipid Delta6-acetylenase / acyl-lipid (9-3)-desaturase
MSPAARMTPWTTSCCLCHFASIWGLGTWGLWMKGHVVLSLRHFLQIFCIFNSIVAALTLKGLLADIDTLPLIAWHEEMAKGASKPVLRLLQWQHYLFFPILCFARMAWAQQSLEHAYYLSRVSKQGVLELFLLLLHYAMVAGGAFATMRPTQAAAFMLMSQVRLHTHAGRDQKRGMWRGSQLVLVLVTRRAAQPSRRGIWDADFTGIRVNMHAICVQVFSGFMLAMVFVQSHNGMEVYMQPKNFVAAQLVSTRNISSSMWMDWFTGGLNFQIEHHLFPTLPRHNLARAKSMVMRFCREHKFVYESCGMDTGTYRVLQRLSSIAASL